MPDSHHMDPLKRFLAKIRRKQQALARNMERLAEQFDILAYTTEQLERNPELLNRIILGHLSPGYLDLQAEGERWLALEAQRGAKSVEVTLGTRGNCPVKIDQRPVFHLPPQLARLLKFLALPGQSDGSVESGWKSKDQALEYLNKNNGSRTLDGIDNLVFRLRTELRLRANMHRNFVEVKDSHIRFRMRT